MSHIKKIFSQYNLSSERQDQQSRDSPFLLYTKSLIKLVGFITFYCNFNYIDVCFGMTEIIMLSTSIRLILSIWVEQIKLLCCLSYNNVST